ncbi:oligosaccharide flippase family protein (plasmid) [Skermanella sp. TT6]|uniref:Oligosaccharide flippase family protein n=1 Tax=Skermanella cutis TaxID=2775420 RepID=A0ABX7BJU3_9PROT|nr:oligosaccharide flippase family protein [Skermanella sp. TT6]QQP92747.1 oligosaccharide flippase family protein [Skermanella sp. TT6]
MRGAEKVGRSIFWALVESGGMVGLSFLVMLFMARSLGPAEFGIASFGFMLMQLLSLLPFSLYEPLVQHKHLTREVLDTGFWLSILAGIGSALILAIGGPLLAEAFEFHGASAPTIAFATVLLLKGLVIVPRARLARTMRFRQIAIRSLSGRLFGGLAGVIIAYLGYGAWALVAQQIIGEAVAAIVILRFGGHRPSWRFAGRTARGLLKFSAVWTIGEFSAMGGSRITQLALGSLFGPSTLGFVNLAQRMVETPRSVAFTAVSAVSVSVLSRHAGNGAKLGENFAESAGFAAFFAMPLFVTFAVLAPDIIGLVVGVQWIDSVPYLRVLALSTAFTAWSVFVNSVASATGKPIWRVVATSGEFVIVIATLMATAPLLGPLSGPISLAAGAALMVPVRLLIVSHLTGCTLTSLGRRIVAPAIAASLMGMAMVSVPWEGTGAAVAKASIGLLVYFPVLLLIDREMLMRRFALMIKVVLPWFTKAKPLGA